MTSEQQTISLAEAKTIANGVLAAERGYVRPDELSEVLFFCDVCETVITPPKTRFCCIECDSFDLCSDCYQRAEPIPGGPPGENCAQSHLRAVHADFVADFVDVAQPVAFAEPLLYRDDNGQAAVAAVPILPPLWRPSSGQQEDAGQRPQRLFRCFVAEPTFQLQFDNDCLSLAATFEPVFVHYAQRPCWGARQRLWDADGSPPTLGDYAWLTFNDVHRLSRQFAAGLLALLDAPAAGQIVGLLSGEELLEKHVADVAVMAWCGGLVSSPINASCSDAELLSVVQLIRTPCLVVAERLFDRLAALLQRHAVPLQLLVVLPNHDLAPDRRYRTDAYPPTPAAQVRRYDDVLALGRRCAGAAAAARGDDVATITWTSGSTGRPKGVTVTQAVWSQTFRHGASKQPVSYAYSYSDRRNTLLGMCTGGRTGFCSGSAASILDDLQRLSPSLLASTPRLFNTVYNDYKEALALRGGDSGVLADYAHIFGRRLKTIVCGGAPPSDAVWTFLQQCFPHCTLTNTYAATECGSIAVNGRLVCQRWRLLDWGDYKSSDVPPRGELAVWTERAAATAYFGSDAAALNSDAWTDDGYYRTGDIVELIGADTIRIVDRKKNLFKLQNGEFVSPERVEAVLLRSRAVDQLCVVGSPHCDFVVAVVVASQSAAAASPQQIVDDLLAVGVSAQLRSFEIPRGVVVAQAPFAPDNGQLTDGGKLLRHNIVAHYADQLQALTEALSERRSSCSSASDPAALLAELVCEALDRRRADIDDDQDLTKLGLTSIGATRILRTVERHFGVKLSLHALFQHATLRRLTALVLPQQTDPADSTSSGEDIDWLAEMQLPDDVLPLAGGQVSCDGHVLLTGATGFLGAFVLEQLLQRWPSTVKIYCLIRGSEPQQRLIEHLRKLGVCDEQTDWSARLCFVNGALDARLGLAADDDDYDALAGQIGVVYHCAAHVNSVLPYAVLKPANVDGTLHVLRFAAHVRAKHVNVVSTLSVLVGYSVIGRLESSLLSAHVPYLRHAGGYTQSKFVADALCLAAKQRGFSVTVFRPGMISADSRSGVSNLQDFDSRLLAGIVKLGAAPFPVQAAFDQTPVNWVAQTIAALGQQPSGSGEGVYHLSNPLGSMDFGQVVLTLVSLGYSLLLVDYQLWLAEHLAALDTDNPIFPLVDAYFAGRTTFPPRRSAAPEELANTTAAVQRLGLEPPPTVDRQLLARQMAWLATQYQLPAPVLTGLNQ